MLIPLALANATAVLGVLLTARAGGPSWALIALAALDGLTIPPVSASMRTLWPVITGGEHVETAFALESVLQEGFYIAGPLLAGLAALVTLRGAGHRRCAHGERHAPVRDLAGLAGPARRPLHGRTARARWPRRACAR